MAVPENHSQRLEEAFDQARREMRGDDSILSQVERRIANTAIKPPRQILHWSALACFCLFALGLTLWCGLQPNASLPHQDQETSQSMENISLELGDTKLAEHLSAMMKDQSVLVIWSCAGSDLSPENTDLAEHRDGKYRFRRLNQVKLANGRTLVCSLFIPDQGVRPIFEPPAITARSSDGGVIRFSAQPTLASHIKLSDAVRAAGFDGNETKKILHEAQTQND